MSSTLLPVRNALSRLLWVLLVIPGIVLSAGLQIAPEGTPYLPYVPAHFPWVKTSWLQNLAERFSNDIDVLSLEFSSILGGWSRQPVIFAITPAKILLLLLILTLGFALAGVARVVILKNYSLSRFKPNTDRFWRDGILFALRRALSGLFIFTGAFFASVPLLPHIGLALGGFPTFAIAAKVAQLGYFATGVAFCLRIVRLVQQWLNDFVNRPSVRWYYSAFPVLGQALYYNLVLFAFSTAIYILDLPGPIQDPGFKILSIAGIITNTFLLIRTVLAVEAMMTSRSEMLHYDAYKKRRVETRVQMIRRLLVFIILVVAIAAILMNFNEVRQIGTGLAGIRWCRRCHCGVRGAEIAFDYYCGTSNRDYAAYENRRCGNRRGRVGNHRRDHSDLRGHPRVGPEASGCPDNLFPGEGIPELDS